MLTFPTTGQHYPDLKSPEARIRDWQEIYAGFDHARAGEQASRCSQCGIPFCQIHCPLQNNIPDWLRMTAEGRLEEAYALAASTNTFPEICGRICPQDRLCEGNCVIERGFGAVTIGTIEKYITETAFEQGWVRPIGPVAPSGFSVGIVGAGPAGLAAADMLRRGGHDVHVYDRYDRAGGLMIYGIPNFKLEKPVVQRRQRWLEDGGIQFHFGSDIGRGLPFAELQDRHDALLIATGVYQARDLGLPDSSLPGIVQALPYLTHSNRRGLDDVQTDPTLDAAGKNVVVIGGGDTAMDCVRTARRQGAKRVTCLYRRDRANMPGSAREVKHAEDEGVGFSWLCAPRAFVGNKRVQGILVQRMRLGAPDAAGRRPSVAIEGDTFELEADLIIQALGFDAEPLPAMFGQPELTVSANGTLAIDAATFQTSLPGVFAAGDIVRGASLVVWAIRDGRDAAQAMHRHLQSSLQRIAS